MAQESRGGGYDLAIDKKNKTALGTKTQQSIGAQGVQSPGSNPSAPRSIGELMTPSASRAAPAGSADELAAATERNHAFLTDPNTRNMLTQFGMSMLSGGSPGHAIYQALTVPERAAAGNAKIAQQTLENQNAQDRIDMERQRLGMETSKFSTEQDKQKNREAVFGALKTMTDDQLMTAASEMASKGDDEGARIALSMSKTLGGNDQATALMKNYQVWLGQGYKGSIQDFQQAMFKDSTLEQIRTKMAQGVPLTPGEKQVYDDAIKADVLTRAILGGLNPADAAALNGGGAGGTTTPAGAVSEPGTSGTSNGVTWSVTPAPK